MQYVIKVFEYDRLSVGDTFRVKHFNALVKYNEKHGNKFFSVGNKKIFFNQYVGVIQVGNLIIEILPKADKDIGDENNKEKWRNALIRMLRECKLVKLESLTNAHLKSRSASLIDLYFEAYISEVQQIIHKGLVKKYRFDEKNLNKLKGRLIFSKNLSKNFIHKERFFTSHQVYDKNNVFNQILKKALETVAVVTTNPHQIARVKTQLLSFENISDIRVSEAVFDRLNYNRQTEPYKYSMTLARLILLNYSPDLKAGPNNVLAILFDMNILFEKYIYRQLKKVEDKFTEYNLTVSGQASREFWQGKTVRPDIVLEYNLGNALEKLIIDTKWKVIREYKPSDADLKQMYVYNVHFGSSESVLLYPKVDLISQHRKAYSQSALLLEKEHYCRLCFAELFDKNNKLKKTIGKVILEELLFIN